MENVISARGLIKTFGPTRALDGLDLEVRRGEVHGFLGPNGAGKSTTIRVLLGLLKADGGEVTLFGGDPWRDAVTLHPDELKRRDELKRSLEDIRKRAEALENEVQANIEAVSASPEGAEAAEGGAIPGPAVTPEAGAALAANHFFTYLRSATRIERSLAWA